MITGCTPYQLFKAEHGEATVSDFSSLPQEATLPYRIAAAEDTLVASLAFVEENETKREKYAISVLHAASAYISHLISYIPLATRSNTAKKVDIHYDAIVRTVMLFGKEMDLFGKVKQLVLSNAPTDRVSLKELSDVDDALLTMEKEYRQRAKLAGEKVDLLKKVAPLETKVSTSSSQGGANQEAEEPVEKDEENSSKATVAKRRGRSSSADGVTRQAPGSNPTSRSAAKVVKLESEEGKKQVARPEKSKKGATSLVWGRLRALTQNEKKVVGMLQSIIQILGHVYAARYNDLVGIFDLLDEKLTQMQSTIDADRVAYEAKADPKLPQPFYGVSLQELEVAVGKSAHTFREDEEYRYELDEDLLHPVAHACLSLINHIEGYTTEPLPELSEEELLKKQEQRATAKAKREEAQKKIMERAKAREETARKKEEEKQLVQKRLGDTAVDEDELVEDMALPHPPPLGYVRYTEHLPLESASAFDKALYIWAMLVSVPRALNLSQMSYSTFLKGVRCEDQDSNGLIEEISKCLLDVVMENVRLTSPNTPRIVTRGKNWFDALVEFVSVASGNKKKRQQNQRRELTPPSDDEDEYSDDDDDDGDDDEEEEEEEKDSDDDSTSPSRSEKSNSGEEKERGSGPATLPTENPTTGVETAADKEDRDNDAFSVELKATIDRIAQLRNLATWGNVEVIDRLNLLQFCVHEALCSEVVRLEADRLSKEQEEEVLTMEKKLKDIRDDASKALKTLRRTPESMSDSTKRDREKPVQANREVAKEEDDELENLLNPKNPGDGGDYLAERDAVLRSAEKKRSALYDRFYARCDERDDGALITPLGFDRYHRLYWRFPLEREIYVQTIPQTAKFPILPEPEVLAKSNRPQHFMLLDDEDGERANGVFAPKKSTAASPSAVDDAATASETSGQRSWGMIPHEYLPVFVQSLDHRGRREALLRHKIESMLPYLNSMEEPREGRVTRSRANMFGYTNQLKINFL